MTETFHTTIVDLYLGEDGALDLCWTKGLGHARRCVPQSQVRRLLTRMQDVRDAEQAHDLARVQAARLVASSELYDLLDGPERALAQRIARAEKMGVPLLVAVRALAQQHDALREHPATRMWWPGQQTPTIWSRMHG
ncbi:hypothetical protein OV203_36130 [Nannocystis sp. ILAH1]|uniref:hypothetical protein n=1 Tax=Nannocystis sp. ILAH1 TaxID=2996789 RepID=UPI00226FAA85|nr:hypothetical protein [Nannocystis sp. ILAH1]MCY0992625.1 hypothetical protein [Nannocystis sp. ILAH1]